MKRMTLAAAAAAALFAAAGPGALAGQTAAATSPAVVDIRNFQFQPATLTVTAGTTVMWKNDDGSPHSVAAQSGAFRSDPLDTKDSYSFTFAAPGTYVYGCTFHPMMIGKIIVKAKGGAS
ncbi:MAG TPA: cupredoxin family copper-binding protein [Stellaceae bacterium]|nr:cupredoxin family copper-binding protein [Stellaceae bacterium]